MSHCAHPARLHPLLCSASKEGTCPRIAQIRWSSQACSFSPRRGSPVDPRVRASNEGLPTFPYLSQREWPKLPSTARIERAHSYRARSASKEGTWLLLPHPSQTARCANIMVLPSLLVFPLGGWPDWSPTARVQRGPSEAARCASTGDQQATLPLPYHPNAHRCPFLSSSASASLGPQLPAL